MYVEDLNEMTKKLLELINDYSKFVRYKVTTQKSIAFLYTSNCQHPLDHRKSKSSRKTSTSALLTMPKPLTMWITTTVIHTTVENSERDGNTRPPDLPLEKPVCRSGSNT